MDDEEGRESKDKRSIFNLWQINGMFSLLRASEYIGSR